MYKVDFEKDAYDPVSGEVEIYLSLNNCYRCSFVEIPMLIKWVKLHSPPHKSWQITTTNSLVTCWENELDIVEELQRLYTERGHDNNQR